MVAYQRLRFLLLALAAFGLSSAWSFHVPGRIRRTIPCVSMRNLPSTTPWTHMRTSNTVLLSNGATKSSTTADSFTALSSSTNGSNDSKQGGKVAESNIPPLLDPGTRGGALVWGLILFILPILVYVFVTSVGGVEEVEAGKWIGVGYTVVITLLWVSTYIFRVATKDMTYAKQLREYENAVIAKRLEELDEDEVQALVEDIGREDF